MKYFKVGALIFALFLFVNGFDAKPDIQDLDDSEGRMHPRIKRSFSGLFKRPPKLTQQKPVVENQDELTAAYWRYEAQLRLKEQLQKRVITNRAKNVIMFLGDGMSIPTVSAARVYLGQLQGHSGEEARISFEEFPYIGLSKTYCVDSQVADSACSATAYLCGVKANTATLGVTAAVPCEDCKAMQNVSNHVNSIADWAQKAGKDTGIVTTTRVTHASPAGTYAHTADRNWEADKDVLKSGNDPKKCPDIAQQLITGEPGKKFKVILGGGRKVFLPKTEIDEEGGRGEREDGVNLIKVWQDMRKQDGVSYKYVWNKKDLLKIDSNKTDYLLGLFESDHCQYNLDANPALEPTLSEMTKKAIEIVSKNKNGYFLFVEGGRIDHAHHDTLARKSLDETVQFADAIRLATQMTKVEDTLIVVTSDHAHTMTFNGYPDRGNNILGLSGMSDIDALPYSTLSYANGPGYQKPNPDGSRHDIREDNMGEKSYMFPALVPLKSETHGGDDVGIFARGPWAHLLTGVIEQNVIPHVMAFAACLGDGLTVCDLHKGI